MEGRSLCHKSYGTDFNELQVNYSSHNEGSYYSSSKSVNECQGDGFLSVGAQVGGIKLVLRIGGASFHHCQVIALMTAYPECLQISEQCYVYSAIRCV